MNARRSEEPRRQESQETWTTADIANPSRVGRQPGSAVIDETDDETNIDSAERRPPQSVAADDTYDGEIVSTTVGPDIQADSERRPVSESAHSVPAPFGTPPRQTPASDSQDAAPGSDSPLFADDELRDFRARWDQVQTSFVDEPRHAVEQADMLVAAVEKRIAEQFAEQRARLERQSDRGEASTEDLRQGFKRYRAFFDRLLTV
jgi:hypothetical protein